jgi:hypothetical protein
MNAINPVVSVIMPVYNVEAFVAEAVRSVLCQTLEEIELIIVDDGSQDDSIAICRAFNDPRIRIVTQRNRGLAAARNTGIAARARPVHRLPRFRRPLGPYKAAAPCHPPARQRSYRCQLFRIAADRCPWPPAARGHAPKLTEVTAADILLRNPVGNGSSPVIRRGALDRVGFPHPVEAGRICWFDESFRQSEDIEMWLRMALRHDCRFEGIEGLLVDYRILGGGLSARIPHQYEAWLRAMEGLHDDAPAFMDHYLPLAKAFQLRYLARRAVQLCDGVFALSLLRDALRASPAILFQEPAKTVQTMAGALAARYLPVNTLRRLASAWTGQGQAA